VLQLFLFAYFGLKRRLSIRGIIFRIESKDYYIYSPEKLVLIRSSLRGKFKQEFKLKKDKLYQTDIATIGDYVEFDLNKDGTGVIHTIEKRKNYISRKAPKTRGAGFGGERLEQLIAANIDNIFIISSTLEPPFNSRVIDRLIVAGESSQLSVFIIINKIDLDTNDLMNYWFNLYKNIGYKIFKTCALTGKGLKEVKKFLKGKKSVFWGQSGVGKSSLLNKIFPELNLQIGKISSYTEKGIHTTVTGIMIKVAEDTYLIDTPGIREIDPFGIRKQDLGHYFIEFANYISDCRFNTCTHQHEPDCAVINAVEKGEITVERYESYLRILDTIEEDIIFK